MDKTDIKELILMIIIIIIMNVFKIIFKMDATEFLIVFSALIYSKLCVGRDK